MKKFMWTIISIVVITTIESYYDNLFVIPKYTKIADSANDLLTISTVLMGFAFSVMGLLYTFNASEFVKKMRGTDFVIKRANTILYSICVLGVASFSNLLLILLNVKKIYKYLYLFSLTSLFLGTGAFIWSTYKVYQLIQQVHKYDCKKGAARCKDWNKPLNNDGENL